MSSLNRFAKNMKSHMKASKNNNVKSNYSYPELILQVPYWDMGTVAEGLKESFLNVSEITCLRLRDETYNIELGIMWMPAFSDNDPNWCQMNRHGYLLFHNEEKIHEWSNTGNEYDPNAVNFKQIQSHINDIVKKDMKEMRNTAENPDDPYVKYFLTGRMIMTAVVPAPTL